MARAEIKVRARPNRESVCWPCSTSSTSWFQEPDFEGCSFINVLLEAPREGSVRAAAAAHLAEIRAILARLATEAGLADPERFARTWHFLMKGCIVDGAGRAAGRGREARQAAQIMLEHGHANDRTGPS